jgi:hypothetical protein
VPTPNQNHFAIVKSNDEMFLIVDFSFSIINPLKISWRPTPIFIIPTTNKPNFFKLKTKLATGLKN